jgi:hypothetical protein
MLRFLSTIALAACAASAPPASRPSAQRTTAPCFPEKPALRAQDIYTQLESFAESLYAGEDTPPKQGTFGTCSVERNVIFAADRSIVGELGCGVRILVPGIQDELGLEVGARGRDVLDRKKPLRRLECIPNGPDQARCMFERAPDTDTDGTWYVVRGALATTITGDEALAYFAQRPIIEIEYSVWCH